MSSNETKTFLDGRVTVVVGDITKQDVEAIVNAANSSLLGGGGVDGAIHRAGGPEILEECRAIRRTRFPEGLPTGEAVITTGGKLPALYVIHTVGPIFGEHRGKEPELLANCYHNSLTLAVEKNLTSVAFPQRGQFNDWLPSLTVMRIIVFSQCRHGIGTVIPGRSSSGTIDVSKLQCKPPRTFAILGARPKLSTNCTAALFRRRTRLPGRL